jgi:hypothetical protein
LYFCCGPRTRRLSGNLQFCAYDSPNFLTQITLSGTGAIKLPYFSSEKSYVLQSEEPKHTNIPLIKHVSDELHLTEWGMDSQAKYCCLARGEGAVYLRMPAPTVGGKQPYEERIWVSCWTINYLVALIIPVALTCRIMPLEASSLRRQVAKSQILRALRFGLDLGGEWERIMVL